MYTIKWLYLVIFLAILGAEPSADAPAKVDAAGVPNLIRLTDHIYQGAAPQGDAGFASLEKLGVKTVISVDGARPDLEDAHKHGIRYVHLPIGYDGMTREQELRLAKAVRDLPGPVFIHCHRGTQRGPTAAAVARLSVEESCGVEAALAGLALAGFDPKYKGLYAAVKDLRKPTAKELDGVSSDFPEAVALPGLTEVMVDLDGVFDRLQAARKANWAAPRNNPELDMGHEALRLEEHFKELRRSPRTATRPEEFRQLLADAESRARELKDVLSVSAARRIDATAAEAAYKQMDAACVKCHAVYRDAPGVKKDR